jgi:isopentenyl-diphosphate delta-isomerase
MGVGSQRAAVEDSSLEYTFRVAREKAPNAFLIANLGAPQLARGYGVHEAEKAVKMIGANALFIHTNPLQEAIQPEGETDYRGVILKIKEIVEGLKVPVIVKETGAGIAAEDAEKMEAVGVRGVDVGGAGGTSWAAVEYFRAKKAKNSLRETLGETFWDWGIPTAASIIEVHQSTKLKVIASGGVRTGLDVAKSIALGADVAGLAMPLLKPALKGTKYVTETLQTVIDGFKTAMFLTGCRKLEDLKRSQVVITGKTADWLEARGFKPEEYARRRY